MIKAKNYLGKIIPPFFINSFFHLPQALFWNLYYRFPARSLTIIGVTGTDGKTTTTTLIWHILKTAGKKAVMITTVKARLGNRAWDTGLHTTTPKAKTIQNFLYQAKKGHFSHAVLETTSHGLDQHRLFGIPFRVGVTTNVTHEHLDYHQTMEKYLLAKARLIRQSQIAVLNRDDWSFKKLSSLAKKKGIKVVSYGIKHQADITPQSFPFKTTLPGEYNQYNCLAAIAATTALNISPAIIRQALKTFTLPRGRMETISLGQNFRVYVDFAHTPNAIKNVLDHLHSQLNLSQKQRLIAVFGSAGRRDPTKRPVMGQSAARFAHLTIITADDPRDEKIEKISREIAQGCLKEGAKEIKSIAPFQQEISTKKHYFLLIPDRRKAIRTAIKAARKGDIVALLGKGHEKSLSIKGKEYPWNEIEEAKKAIKKFAL